MSRRSIRSKQSINYANIEKSDSSDDDFAASSSRSNTSKKKLKGSTFSPDKQSDSHTSCKLTEEIIDITVDTSKSSRKRSRIEDQEYVENIRNDSCKSDTDDSDFAEKTAKKTKIEKETKPKNRLPLQEKNMLQSVTCETPPQAKINVPLAGSRMEDTKSKTTNPCTPPSSSRKTSFSPFKQSSWTPPGTAGDRFQPRAAETCPSTLRLGLSRNVRLKPLHTSTKTK